ncbi:unnamed protein product (macronuclear) [Paramecium tetraurelia]|uniref:Transmembrane protein n=1 Tax=Paramecium tetraurelia TaxID=5888 RepID=A0DL13_PARTE|nr:uncharacterized protein GSPATT00018047001 [Paramecium tetraurelia]CAK83730.1 unnamed protein product [Paramecium tetraurelia]|eukprot:XP_001451127.1 hypothetical protein (macronuclear) [Paramecium tetraurelia strain d4-2]
MIAEILKNQRYSFVLLDLHYCKIQVPVIITFAWHCMKCYFIFTCWSDDISINSIQFLVTLIRQIGMSNILSAFDLIKFIFLVNIQQLQSISAQNLFMKVLKFTKIKMRNARVTILFNTRSPINQILILTILLELFINSNLLLVLTFCLPLKFTLFLLNKLTHLVLKFILSNFQACLKLDIMKTQLHCLYVFKISTQDLCSSTFAITIYRNA